MLLFREFVIFTFASSVGYVGILMLMFSLFKIQYRWYIPHMVFVCVFLSYISFTMRMTSLAFYTPTVQMITLIVIMWLLFRFRLLYAAVMTLTGSFLSAVIDTIWVLLFLLIGYRIEPFSAVMYLGSVIAGSTNILIAWLIRKQRWGFSFIREDEAVKSGKTKPFLWISVIIFSVVGYFIIFVFALVRYSLSSLLFAMLQLFVACAVLIYLSYRREKREYERKDGFRT